MEHRRPAASFQGSFPRGVTQVRLSSPAMSVTTPVRCCLPGKLISDSVPGDFMGLLTQTPAAGDVPKIPPRMQAVFPIHHHGLHRQFRHSDIMMKTLLKAKFPEASRGQPHEQACVRMVVQACCGNSFVHCPISISYSTKLPEKGLTLSRLPRSIRSLTGTFILCVSSI